MNALRAFVVETALSDFLAHPDFPGESILCRHLRREHEASFRIKAKRIWKLGDQAGFARFLAESLLHEGRFQKLLVSRETAGLIRAGKALAPSEERACSGRTRDAKPNTTAQRRQAAREAREALRLIAETSDTAALNALDPGVLRSAAEAMLEAAPQTGAFTILMECRLDERMGEHALGSERQRKKTRALALAKVATPLPPVNGDYRALEDALLAAEAREWLVNAGCSLRDGRADGVMRTKDVPVGLVELCLNEANGQTRPPRRISARDALTLYRALNEDGAARRYVVIPLERDPATGAELLILSTGFCSDDIVSWLYPDIDRRRARAARADRRQPADEAEARRIRVHNRQLELDARRRAALRGNACVIAMTAHAYAVDALVRARSFETGFESSARTRPIEGIFRDEISVWPAPVTDTTAMEQVFARFRRTFGADAGATAFAAYQAMNEDAPVACPPCFLPYFYEGESAAAQR